MNKGSVIPVISKRLKLPQYVVMNVVDELLDEIRSSLIKGEDVELRGFGSFIVKQVKERPATMLQGPRKGERMVIPARKIIKVKISKEIRTGVNNKE